MYKIQVQEEQDFLVFLLCRGMCQEMLFSKYEAWLIHQDPIIEAIDRILIIGLSLLTFLNKKKVEKIESLIFFFFLFKKIIYYFFYFILFLQNYLLLFFFILFFLKKEMVSCLMIISILIINYWLISLIFFFFPL